MPPQRRAIHTPLTRGCLAWPRRAACLFDIRLGFQNITDVDAPRVTKEGGGYGLARQLVRPPLPTMAIVCPLPNMAGKRAIEEAGLSMGRKVEVILTPLGL